MDIDLLPSGFPGEVWPHAAALLTLTISALASGHAVLNKREARAAVAWVGLIWLVPILGAVLYLLLGINRIRRRAMALRADLAGYNAPVERPGDSPMDVEAALRGHGRLFSLSRLVGEVLQRPLVGGNSVIPLEGGDTAYPAMLEAIDGAGSSVTLSTYIFDNDRAGGLFMDALTRAVGRGVAVRVLVDDVGARYSWPPVTRVLHRRGVTVARFLPTRLSWWMPFVNLRNHRKVLVVDGRVGFTGGMNIREGLLLSLGPRRPVQDLHFRAEGPVVAHLQEVFAADWFFCTGERMEGERWFPPLESKGSTIARGIPDGPDEDFEKLLWTVHGALACARSSVRIMTPYFLPSSALITSLNVAAMRGIEVDIILPSVNNLPLVKWASMHIMEQLLQYGCRLWLTPPPFDHTKLMLVDGAWVLFGSGNWDARSFRLNFEFNVECYDLKLAARLGEMVDARLRSARRVGLDEVVKRSLPVRLRDGIARLFSPYL